MITLYGFGEYGDLPDASAFVLKVDAYLRMTGREYQAKSGMAYARKALNGIYRQ